jgi:hypothetical protein
MLRVSAALAPALALSAALVAAAGACGTNAGGVDACKAVEEARCRQVPDCPAVQVSPPIYYTTGSAVDACIRFYDTACGHGLSSGDPGQTAVNACVTAIAANGCGVVAAPESDPACAWLAPPDSGGGSGDGAAGSDSVAADALIDAPITAPADAGDGG